MIQTTNDPTITPSVERRAEPRWKTAHSVLITAPNTHPMEAWLLDLSSTGARVRMPEPAAVGSKLKMEAKDLLLYGTVVRCTSVHGAYEAGMALEHPLEFLGELRRLNAALLSE